MNLENSTTPPPVTPEVTLSSRDSYTAAEEAIKSIKAEMNEKMLSGDMDAVMELAGKTKKLEADKAALFEQSRGEAITEDTERTAAANAEKMMAQAQVEAIDEDEKRTKLAEIQKRQAQRQAQRKADDEEAAILLAEIQGGSVVAEATPVVTSEQSEEGVPVSEQVKEILEFAARRANTDNYSGRVRVESEYVGIRGEKLKIKALINEHFYLTREINNNEISTVKKIDEAGIKAIQARITELDNAGVAAALAKEAERGRESDGIKESLRGLYSMQKELTRTHYNNPMIEEFNTKMRIKHDLQEMLAHQNRNSISEEAVLLLDKEATVLRDKIRVVEDEARPLRETLDTLNKEYEKQNDIFNKEIEPFHEALKDIDYKERKTEIIEEASDILDRITDRSYDGLKTRIKGFIVRPGMGDTDGFSSGEQAVAYMLAVTQAEITPEQKLDLMNDVYHSMIGYNGKTASDVFKDLNQQVKESIPKAGN